MDDYDYSTDQQWWYVFGTAFYETPNGTHHGSQYGSTLLYYRYGVSQHYYNIYQHYYDVHQDHRSIITDAAIWDPQHIPDSSPVWYGNPPRSNASPVDMNRPSEIDVEMGPSQRSPTWSEASHVSSHIHSHSQSTPAAGFVHNPPAPC